MHRIVTVSAVTTHHIHNIVSETHHVNMIAVEANHMKIIAMWYMNDIKMTAEESIVGQSSTCISGAAFTLALEHIFVSFSCE